MYNTLYAIAFYFATVIFNKSTRLGEFFVMRVGRIGGEEQYIAPISPFRKGMKPTGAVIFYSKGEALPTLFVIH